MESMSDLIKNMEPQGPRPDSIPCSDCGDSRPYYWNPIDLKWAPGICSKCQSIETSKDYHIKMEAARRSKIQELLTASPIGTEYQEATFENFIDINEKQIAVVESARHFTSIIIQGHEIGWMILVGTFGTGKTRILSAMYKALAENNKVPIYYQGPALVERLKADSRTGIRPFIKELLKADLLLLDDIDESVISSQPYIQSAFRDILDALYSNKKPMVMATNSDYKGIVKALGPKIESRMVQRIMENVHICQWDDFRKR